MFVRSVGFKQQKTVSKFNKNIYSVFFFYSSFEHSDPLQNELLNPCLCLCNEIRIYISTRSTLIPQDSVASSNDTCMVFAMASLSLRISCSGLVPKTFRNVV